MLRLCTSATGVSVNPTYRRPNPCLMRPRVSPRRFARVPAGDWPLPSVRLPGLSLGPAHPHCPQPEGARRRRHERRGPLEVDGQGLAVRRQGEKRRLTQDTIFVC